MAQVIISLGGIQKNIILNNKIEAKNYINEIKHPALILSTDLNYQNDPDFNFLSYQLIENLKQPSLIIIDPVNNPTIQIFKSVLSRLKAGLIIIDMANYLDKFDEFIKVIEENKNSNINILLNIPDIKLCKDYLHKIHTGWRVLNSLNKSSFEWMKKNIGDLDAVGLLLTGALRDEYIKTYKVWAKKEGKKTSPDMLNMPFYYSFSTIHIKKDVFNELINPVLEKLKLFKINYSSNDISEMYL